MKKTTIVIEIVETVIDDTGASAVQSPTSTVRNITVGGVPYYMDTILPDNKNTDPTPISDMCDFVQGKKTKQRNIYVNIDKLFNELVMVNTKDNSFDEKDFLKKLKQSLNLALADFSYVPA